MILIIFAFDLIVNTGDIFNTENGSIFKDISIEVLGAVITSIVSILILINTFKIEKNKQELLEVRTNHEKVYYLISMLNKIIISSKEQLEELNSFIENQKKDEFNLQICRTISSENIKRLTEQLNHKELYVSFISCYQFNNERTEEFHKIFTICDYLRLQNINISADQSESHDIHLNDKRNFNTIFLDVIEQIVFNIKNNKEIQKEDNLFEYLDEKIIEYKSNKKSNIEISEPYYFIKELILEIITVYKSHPQTNSLLSDFKKMTLIVENIVFSNESRIKNYEKACSEYDSKIKDLELIYNNLNDNFSFDNIKINQTINIKSFFKNPFN